MITLLIHISISNDMMNISFPKLVFIKNLYKNKIFLKKEGQDNQPVGLFACSIYNLTKFSFQSKKISLPLHKSF